MENLNDESVLIMNNGYVVITNLKPAEMVGIIHRADFASSGSIFVVINGIVFKDINEAKQRLVQNSRSYFSRVFDDTIHVNLRSIEVISSSTGIRDTA